MVYKDIDLTQPELEEWFAVLDNEPEVLTMERYTELRNSFNARIEYIRYLIEGITED